MSDGTIVNPTSGDYDQGALLVNSNGGSSIGLSGAFPNPTYIQVATVEQATWELTAWLQIDQAQTAGRMVMQVNSGANVAGGAECKFLADGAGGMKFRFESADDTPTRVIKEGSTTGQVPIGETVMVSFVRTAADMECYLNGEARSLSLLSGALATWSAPAAGTTYLGAFVSGANSSNGLDALLGEWLITSPLTADQRAFLAAHTRQNVVAALDLDAGEINEGVSGENFSVLQRVHPATGTMAISTPASEGTAEEAAYAIVYTPPASVSEDTPDTVGYTNTVGAVTSAEATFSITVLNSSGPTPPSTLAEDVPLPTPLDTIAGTTANFNSLLGSGGTAQPGDRINLANGSYGARTISVSGTQANPIVVRASSLHGAATGSITVNGDWVIVSGLNISGQFTSNGSNNRCTRCLIHGGSIGFLAGPGAHDILIDHCAVYETTDRMFYLADPKDQLRIIVARCWCHTLLPGGGTTVQSHGFIWADENDYREKPHDYIIVRFNYLGPGVASGESSDYIHDKQSDVGYVCNRFDVGSDQLSLRFGLRKRFIANYAPGCPVIMYDVLGWYFGNSCGTLRGSGGRSAYYDDTKNIPLSVGGFHATGRTRIAGNIASITLPDPSLGPNTSWCTTTQHATLPDPQPCGVLKPARSSGGITYAADDPNHPDRGIKIRAHSGTVTLSTATCVNIPGDGRWVAVAEIDSQPAAAAPAAWLTELFDEYPWLEALCPNPTSQTGGPGAAHPSFVAQQLTRGDAGTPNTGPFRNSAGGLP